MAAIDFVYLFNGFETVLWSLMSFWVGTQAVKTPKRRGRLLLGAVTFAAFAGSEMVEMQTGAWWRPVWLMLWKGLCIVILTAVGVDHFRWLKHQARNGETDSSQQS